MARVTRSGRGNEKARGDEWQGNRVAEVTSGSGVSVMGNKCQEAFMLF